MSTDALNHSVGCLCGFCHCGCGRRTGISKKTVTHLGLKRGAPTRFICGHYHGRKGRLKKGGIHKHLGYTFVHAPGHPRAGTNGYIQEHVLIALRTIGPAFRVGAVVHHVNEDRGDNRRQNLVICPDNTYHHLLHYRLRALRSSGHADYLHCHRCYGWRDPREMRCLRWRNKTMFFCATPCRQPKAMLREGS